VEGTEVKIGAIDIGTNSVRLLVASFVAADLFGPERLAWLDRRVTVTGLGQGVDAAGRFHPDAVGRTLAVLAGYGEALRAWGVDQAAAVATSAARDAADREAFLDRAERALGFRPTVIPGDEEAALSFRGATADIEGAGPFLVIDPGGGSTEFVLGKNRPDHSVSVDMGSVRLTERALPLRPATPGQLDRARAEVARHLRNVRLPDEPGTVVGVGGTFTSLAAIALDLPQHDMEMVHGFRLGVGRLAELVQQLSDLSIQETAAIPSLDPARAPVILAGAVIAHMSAIHVGASEITVSESDVLDGVALETALALRPAP
jgi:exopolyphosphatase/guanosine-5'-triphosphate,3'-diphosphate pyrophosphatase